jgi:hypothetical protein
METYNDVKPCPVCNMKMVLRQISALGERGERRWFYFMYCRECGYGPTQAYETGNEAIQYWNHNALSARRTHYPYWI